MELTFVTGNMQKFAEMQLVVENYNVELVQNALEIDEPENPDLRVCVLHKAKKAYAVLKKPLIVEDTGVYFIACNNFPGTTPRRVFEKIGYEGLFKALEGKSRNAYFRTLICFIEAPEKFKLFEGRLYGTITDKVILPEKDRMPYEKIFLPIGETRVLVEMTTKEKNEMSHRSIAAEKLGQYLKKEFYVESGKSI